MLFSFSTKFIRITKVGSTGGEDGGKDLADIIMLYVVSWRSSVRQPRWISRFNFEKCRISKTI